MMGFFCRNTAPFTVSHIEYPKPIVVLKHQAVRGNSKLEVRPFCVVGFPKQRGCNFSFSTSP